MWTEDYVLGAIEQQVNAVRSQCPVHTRQNTTQPARPRTAPMSRTPSTRATTPRVSSAKHSPSNRQNVGENKTLQTSSKAPPKRPNTGVNRGS